MTPIVSLVVMGLTVASCTTIPDAAPTSQPTPKLAVFTFSGGFRHSSLETAEQTLRKIGERSGLFEAVLFEQYKQEADKLDLSMIDGERLKEYHAILFYTTSGPKDMELLTAAQREALIGAIRGGKAFIGVHSATDTFYDWPEYGEMIGGYFDGHPWNADSAPVTIKIEDREHPASKPLGASWFLQEEIYQFKAPYDRSKLHVLMSLDTDATDMTMKGVKRTDGDFALAWTKWYGKGRVFYTALGHREDVWENELFQRHLLGGIKWAMGFALGEPMTEEQRRELAVGKKTPGGVLYYDLSEGEGPAVARFQVAVVHYSGRLENGRLFDASTGKPPLEFRIGRGEVIAGWEEGIVGMKKGGKRKLIIPPGMGYGSKGSPPAIPPDAQLTFEVELVEIKE